MAYYFCLRDALTKLEAAPEGLSMAGSFLELYDEPPEGKINKVDVLILEKPDILDLTSEEGAFDFTALLAQQQLYRLNTEILLDNALDEAQSDNALKTALQNAFPEGQYPEGQGPEGQGPEGQGPEDADPSAHQDLEGNLKHPALAHISDAELAQIYCTFVQQLDKETAANYALTHILRQHSEAFLESFEGYRDNAGIFISLKRVFFDAHRADYDSSKPIEDYIENGRDRATSMGLKTFENIAQAYLDAEEYQLRRAQDIDTVMARKWEETPAWIRQDIFALLEREAMKQVFALHLVEAPDFAALFETRPALIESIKIHSDGHVETELQQLLTETLNTTSGYSGSAGRFAAKVEARLREKKAA